MNLSEVLPWFVFKENDNAHAYEEITDISTWK